MKIVGIIQARMGSTRLPGKVLLDLAGEPMLARVVNRVRRATTLNKVVVATPDREITDLCALRGWPCSCGSEEDVLDRYYQAALAYDADVVVRVTADCPLIDPEMIDQIVREFLAHDLDYVTNRLPPRTFAVGQELDVITFEALKRAWHEDDNPKWREHVTPYIYHHPEKFKIKTVGCSVDYSSIRLTVDTPEDLDFVRHIYNHFGHDRFTWHELLALLQKHPEWLEINKHVEQRGVRYVEA